MEKQLDTAIETSVEQITLRDLLSSEIVLVGGGEIVVCGI